MCSFCTEEFRSSKERSYIPTDMKPLWSSPHGFCCTFKGKACYTCSCPKSCTGAHPHTIFFLKHKLVHTGKVQCSENQPCLGIKLSQEQSIFIRSLIIQALKRTMLGSPLKMGKRVLSCSSTPSHSCIDGDHKMATVTAH